jgi:hypothetical protein
MSPLPKLAESDTPLYVFLQAAAGLDHANDLMITGQGKRSRREWVKHTRKLQLMLTRHKWAKVIEAFASGRKDAAEGDAVEQHDDDNRHDHMNDDKNEEDLDDEEEDDMADGNQRKRKSSIDLPTSRLCKKQKGVDHASVSSSVTTNDEVTFEKLILDQLPVGVKNRFGQIRFARWGKGRKSRYLPVLIVNPFDIPLAEVRQDWIIKFYTNRNRGTLAKMTNLVFWYGSATLEPSAFSFVSTKYLVDFDKGCRRGYNELPERIANMLKYGQVLSTIDSQHIQAVLEMVEDLLYDEPDQRWHSRMLSFSKNAYDHSRSGVEEELKMSATATREGSPSPKARPTPVKVTTARSRKSKGRVKDAKPPVKVTTAQSRKSQGRVKVNKPPVKVSTAQSRKSQGRVKVNKPPVKVSTAQSRKSQGRAKVNKPLSESCEFDKLHKIYHDLGDRADPLMMPPSQFQPPELAGKGRFCQANRLFRLLLAFPRKLAGVAYRRRGRFDKVMREGRCRHTRCERDPSFDADMIGKKYIMDPEPNEWPPGFDKLKLEDVIILDKNWIVPRPTGKGKETVCLRRTYLEDAKATKPKMFAHLVCERECKETLSKRVEFIRTLQECARLKGLVKRGKKRTDLSELYMCCGMRFGYRGTKLECYTYKKGVDKATQDEYNHKIAVIMNSLWQIAFGKVDPDDLNAMLSAAQVTKFSDVTMGKNGLHSQFACSRNYLVMPHTDEDGMVGVICVLDPNEPDSRHVITHFLFPEFQTAFPLMSGDILVFDPRVMHCCCNPRDKNAFIFSLYTSAKTVHAHIAQWMLEMGLLDE